MILARMIPASLGFDLRTFECVKCGTVEKIIVETNAHKWSVSDLQAPT